MIWDQPDQPRKATRVQSKLTPKHTSCRYHSEREMPSLVLACFQIIPMHSASTDSSRAKHWCSEWAGRHESTLLSHVTSNSQDPPRLPNIHSFSCPVFPSPVARIYQQWSLRKRGEKERLGVKNGMRKTQRKAEKNNEEEKQWKKMTKEARTEKLKMKFTKLTSNLRVKTLKSTSWLPFNLIVMHTQNAWSFVAMALMITSLLTSLMNELELTVSCIRMLGRSSHLCTISPEPIRSCTRRREPCSIHSVRVTASFLKKIGGISHPADAHQRDRVQFDSLLGSTKSVLKNRVLMWRTFQKLLHFELESKCTSQIQCESPNQCGGVLIVRETQLLSGNARGCSPQHQGIRKWKSSKNCKKIQRMKRKNVR